MQPLVRDSEGVVRFQTNELVNYLKNNYPGGLHALAGLNFSEEDYTQLMQLIGYSVSGFGELSLVSLSAKDLADRKCFVLLEGKTLEYGDTSWRDGYTAGRAAAFQEMKQALADIDDT